MITPFYAAILSLLFVALSFRALILRRKLGVSVGSGEDKTLERAIRVHSNFAEYAPLSILLIYFLEVNGVSGVLIHLLCVALLIGRVIHAYGVSQTNENFSYRVFGMVLTLGVIMTASFRLIALSLVQ